MAQTPSGYLLIADISGYTQYLSTSELEHAREILTVLLQLLADHTRPPLVISRLRIVTLGLMPIPVRNTFIHVEYKLEPIADGTRLTQSIAMPTGPWLGRIMIERMLPLLAKQAQKDIEKFKRHVEDDLARQPGGLQPQSEVTAEMIGAAAAASVARPERAAPA